MIPNVASGWNDEFKDLIGLGHSVSFSAEFLLITGDNACGKSLLRRMLNASLRKVDISVIHLSQQGRSTEGFGRAMIYGSEADEATGVISAKVIVNGFKQNRDKPYILLYDEPEIGMGEEAQMGIAQFFRESFKQLPLNCEGVILFTHSRILVSGLADCMQFIHLGNQYQTAGEWLRRKLVPLSPQELVDRGHENWGRVQDFLNAGKKGT